VTFCGQWAISNLLAYLNGKKLGPEERLFNTYKESVESYFRSRAQEFLGSWNGRNNPASPHSLRHGFRSIVHESKLVRSEDLEFFMGHGKRNKIETTYTDLNVESWRELYAPALKVLEPSFILEKQSQK
jgi:integrase